MRDLLAATGTRETDISKVSFEISGVLQPAAPKLAGKEQKQQEPRIGYRQR
jgi:hypothetical protein